MLRAILILLAGICNAVLFGAAIYIALHFVEKFW